MSDRNFLAEFIKEPIYVIKESLSTPEVQKAENSVPKEIEDNTVVEEPEVALSAPPTPLPTKGENLKHCIVLLDTEAEIISASDEEFLYKILGAVKRSSNDVLIANINGANKDSIDALLAEHNHRHLLAFGLENLPDGTSAPLYEIKSVSGRQYLLADHLHAIAQDQDKKKALWKALQSMFL